MAAGLQRFAVTENDSVWQLLWAIRHVRAPEVRAKVFQHALEEAHHSAEFDRVSRSIHPTCIIRPVTARKPILQIESPDPIMHFMAYAHVGEDDVFGQFDAYAAAVGLPEVQAVFNASKADERGHAGLTLQLCRRSAPSLSVAKMAILRVRIRRLYDAWLRFSKHLGEFTSGVLLSVLYLTLGLLAGARQRDSKMPQVIGQGLV
jgi:hypothetical protein